ncbi:hypothetical protein BN988_01631 [Oceanobacillus picturae]|uniref:Uncharacterized protein n=1 Tax=Oceanobacillus picturae TaxID=171693 RepID=W9AKF4_9BACI|nr:hypothetical protein BN988_01631 [Oceanobacillus picturae]
MIEYFMGEPEEISLRHEILFYLTMGSPFLLLATVILI